MAGTIRDFTDVLAAASAAMEEGRIAGEELLASPSRVWRSLMRENPRFRSFGTLTYLLSVAHATLDEQPTRAYELTAAVLRYVDLAEGPTHAYTVHLRALARKEYGQALGATDDLQGALAAIQESIAIYDEAASGLVFQASVTRLAEARIRRQLGDTEGALQITRSCIRAFEEYASAEYLVISRMIEASILFSCHRYEEAMATFVQLAEAAEQQNDRSTLARALQNTAACARVLGDVATARELYGRALPIFEELNLATEIPRVQWLHALCCDTEGRTHEAISELFKARAMFLHLGQNVDAATVAMDIIRIKFENDEDVTPLCAELVRTLTAAGLTQNAIEALAYLREQSRHRSLTVADIGRARTYFVELKKRPTALFLQAKESEG